MSTEKKFTIMKVLESAAIGWFFATYVLFLVDKGMSLRECNVINTFFMVGLFILEAPTGYLGDRLGHRKVYLAGLIVLTGSFTWYGFGQTFWHFVSAELLGALGRALVDEALEAWIRNELGNSEFNRIRKQARKRGVYWSIGTALVGGWLGSQYSLAIPWFLTGASMGVLFIIGLFVLRNGDEKHKIEKVTLTELLGFKAIKTGFTAIRSVRELTLVSLLGLVAFATYQPINMFWSVTFREIGVPEKYLGSFWILIALAIAQGTGRVAHESRITRQSIARTVILIGIGIGLSGTIGLVLGEIGVSPVLVVVIVLGGFLVHEFYRGSLEQEISTYQNKEGIIDERYRATINSATKSLRTVGSALGLLLSGFASDVLPTLALWGVSGVILIATGIWYSRAKA